MPALAYYGHPDPANLASSSTNVSSGVGAPAVTTGFNTGAIYYDTATGNTYTFTGSAWVLLGKGFTIPVITVGSGTPLNSTIYYFGGDSLTLLQTIYANASVKVPKSGTIKAAFFKWSITTPGTGELVPHSIRVNDTTDVAVQSVAMNAARVDVFSNSLNQAVNAGDTLVLKMATPAWVTAPATIRVEGYVYIE
jgi:hypothetical protein